MNSEIKKEIEIITESAQRLMKLTQGNPALTKNIECLLTFVYILDFITPFPEK